ncbi:MAG: regulatory protein RecX [bacterium]|nr:regulatory protein RecX [bacterium]MDD4558293.1 regulatory protein RecX [bacterium]
MLRKVRMDDPVAAAYEAALVLLTYRDRSLWEIRDRLKRKSYDEDVIEIVIIRLADEGLLDDERFVHSAIRTGMGARPTGKRRLGYELKKKGIADEIINEGIREMYSDDDEEALAISLAEARWERLSGLTAEKRLLRLTGYLSRRGFSYEAVKRALSHIRLNFLDTLDENEVQ